MPPWLNLILGDAGPWGHATQAQPPFILKPPCLSPPPRPHTDPWGHATLGQPPPPPPQRFQEVEEAHLRHMKGLIGSYSHSVEDTHVQIGQVRG